MKSRRFLLPVIISAPHFCMENQLVVIKGFLDLINAAFRVRQLRFTLGETARYDEKRAEVLLPRYVTLLTA